MTNKISLSKLRRDAETMHAKQDKYWAVVGHDGLSQSDFDTVMDYRDTANPDVILKLVEFVNSAPKGCVCHVKEYDGYHGTLHTETCKRYREAQRVFEVEE